MFMKKRRRTKVGPSEEMLQWLVSRWHLPSFFRFLSIFKVHIFLAKFWGPSMLVLLNPWSLYWFKFCFQVWHTHVTHLAFPLSNYDSGCSVASYSGSPANWESFGSSKQLHSNRCISARSHACEGEDDTRQFDRILDLGEEVETHSHGHRGGTRRQFSFWLSNFLN